jgi:hypothetical protein
MIAAFAFPFGFFLLSYNTLLYISVSSLLSLFFIFLSVISSFDVDFVSHSLFLVPLLLHSFFFPLFYFSPSYCPFPDINGFHLSSSSLLFVLLFFLMAEKVASCGRAYDCIFEVPGANLGLGTDYPGYP